MSGRGGTIRISNGPAIPVRKWLVEHSHILQNLPAQLECYRKLIEAFEEDMPNSLPAYRDWCEEHGWQERLKSLDRLWKAYVAKHG